MSAKFRASPALAAVASVGVKVSPIRVAMAPRFAAAAALALLAGCAGGPAPKNAAEFRAAVADAMSAKKEVHEVKRPLAVVAEAVRRQASECLNVAVRTISRGYGSGPSYTATYKPTVVSRPERFELHVQQHVDNTVKVYAEPPGGYYLLVMDAEAAGAAKTRLTFYRPAWGYDVLVNAVRNWAAGENLDCPDLTRIAN